MNGVRRATSDRAIVPAERMVPACRPALPAAGRPGYVHAVRRLCAAAPAW
ncbi:hypothetical protein ABGB17_26310 [Sphaerisporangium sp. B11E5]